MCSRRHIVLAVLVLAATACGGDFYDNAPAAAPAAPAPKKSEQGPQRPAFVLGKGVPQDVEDAAWAAKLKCDGGDARACTDLGKLFASNEWGSRNDARAAELYTRACAGGDSAACEDLADAYTRGRGVPRDPEKARELYDRACRGERAYACGELGAMIAAGYGTERDFKRAQAHLAHACEEGDSPSCELARVVEACEKHDRRACERINQLKSRYTAQDAASAQLEAGAVRSRSSSTMERQSTGSVGAVRPR